MFKITILITALLLMAGTFPAQSVDGDIEKLNAEMVALYGKGDFDGALPVANRIVNLTEQKFGKNGLMTAKALKNRGFIENAKGDTKRAASTFEDAADVFKKQPDLNKTDGASYAEVLEILGGMRLRERVPSAQDTIELALKWREKSNGTDSVETAVPVALLASLHFWNREYKKSSELYKRALLTLAKTAKPPNDELTAVYYRTECAFRKAKIESEFEPLKSAYNEERQMNFARNKKASLISGGVLNGRAIELTKPAYPAEARRARASGTVSVDVLISETGQILSACGAAGAHPALVEASEIAAYNSRFSPTTLEGNPVKVSGRITYNFRP